MMYWQFAGALAMLAFAGPLRAQPAPAASHPEAEQRAQKEADKVFTWIRTHTAADHATDRGAAAQPKERPAAKRTPAAADLALEPLETPLPAIPPELRRELASGLVQVKFTVDPSGRVTDAEAVKSTSPKLNRAAIDTVLRWRFKPIARPQQGVADLDFKPATP